MGKMDKPEVKRRRKSAQSAEEIYGFVNSIGTVMENFSQNVRNATKSAI